MAAILNSTVLDSDIAILDSDTFLSSLRFTQKHSPSTLTLTHTNSIWLTWWWQPSWILPSWILPSWIQPFCTKLWLKLIQSDSNSFILTQLDDGSHLEFYHVGFRHHLSFPSQTYSHLPKLIPTICTKKTSDSLLKLILWLKLNHSHLMMAAILNSGHLGFSHSFSSQSHSHLPRLVPTICTKKPSLIHSDSTWWWQPSWILPCWIQTLPSWIQTPCQRFTQKHSHSTQTLDSN